MDYVLIEMHTVIIVLAVLCLLSVGIFLIGLSLAEERCKTRQLCKRNRFLRERLSSTQQDLYKATYKLPEYEEIKENG